MVRIGLTTRWRTSWSEVESMKLSILIFISLSIPCLALAQEPRMISIGDRRIAVYCDGDATGSPTVILIPAGGRTAKDWEKVQPAVSKFARVCSYDHANFGASDRAPVQQQSIDRVVDDLHAWLKASAEKNPFILVGHSVAGIYSRRFATRYPAVIAGFVFVDSSHEEQGAR